MYLVHRARFIWYQYGLLTVPSVLYSTLLDLLERHLGTELHNALHTYVGMYLFLLRIILHGL